MSNYVSFSSRSDSPVALSSCPPIWLRQLIQNSVDPETLILKSEIASSDISPEMKQEILKCDQLAKRYLKENPLEDFDAKILLSYYLVSKNAYSWIQQASSKVILRENELKSSQSHTPNDIQSLPNRCHNLHNRRRALTLGQSININPQPSLSSTPQHLNYTPTNPPPGYYEFPGSSPESSCESGDIDQLLRLFKSDLTNRPRMIKIILGYLEKIYQKIFINSEPDNGIESGNFSATRMSILRILNECEDNEIQIDCLKKIIDLMHHDPIDEDSFHTLVLFIETFSKYIYFESNQNFALKTLLYIIQAYSLSVVNLRLHLVQSKTVIKQEIKDLIWDKADSFSVHNTSDNFEINFWIAFTIQAAQKLKTEISKTEETLLRLMHGSAAVLGVAAMLSRKRFDDSVVLKSIEHLKFAFYHIPSVEDWFEPLLVFKNFCHLVRSHEDRVSDLAELAFKHKLEPQRDKSSYLFIGIIICLENLILNTSNANVVEQSLKIFLTYLFFGCPKIKSKVIQSLLTISNQGKGWIQTTTKSLLILIDETISHDSDLTSLKINFKSDFSALNQQEQQLSSHCLGLYIRRVINIKTERGVFSEPLIAYVARAQTEDLEEDKPITLGVLQALKKILPSGLVNDNEGNTMLHICILRRNRALIAYLYQTYGSAVDPNALNSKHQSPLHLCADSKFPFLEVVGDLAQLGAEPNLRDRHGKTFLHLLIEFIQPVELLFILQKIQWTSKEKIDLDKRDSSGKTSLRLCLEHPSDPRRLAIAEILISQGCNLSRLDYDYLSDLEVIIQKGLVHLLQSLSSQQLLSLNSDRTLLMMALTSNHSGVLPFVLNLYRRHALPIQEIEIVFLFQQAIFYLLRDQNKYLIELIIKNSLDSKDFKSALDRTFSGLTWDFNDGSFSFFYQNQPINLELLLAKLQVRALSSSDSLLKINDPMIECLLSRSWTPQNSSAKIENLKSQLRKTPASLHELSLHGRTCLHFALLEGSSEVLTALLKFDSQDANSADFQGNTPLHCAAATLNAEAYANILRKSHLPSPKHAYFNRSLSSNGNEPSHCSEINPLARNKLDLIPLILSFPLPPLMRPQPLSQPSFASNILIHYSDEDHKKFLIILEQTIAFKNNIPSKTSLCPDVLELNSASNRRSDSLKPSFYRPQSLPAYMPTNSRDRSELENYKSRQGWNLLHYAAVYGHSRQAYEIVTRLPSLFTEATLSKGAKLPLQYAFFLKRYDVAKALIAGWIHQAKSTLQPYKELARLLSAFKIDLGLFLTEIEDIPSLKAFYAELCISQQLGQSLSPASAKSERFSFRAASLTIRSSRARIFLEKRFDIAKIAVSKGQVEVLELFDKEILDLYDHQEETILIEAVKHLQINCIQYLVKIASEHHKFLNSLNLFGQNALHTLCCIQRPQAKEKLKQEYEKRNVEVNERRLEEDLDTQLVQCFRLLLQAGIDLSAVDETGNNCFHLMAAYNHVAMLEYWKQSVIEEMPKGEAENKLQQYLGATNDDNRSPIFMSVANSSQESFEWLLNNSKQLTIDLGIRSIDIFGFTLAIIAAQEGNLLILEKLLPETELDQVNDLGETALSAAAFNRRLKTVEYLLKMSSSSLSFRRPNHMGRTALHQVFLVTSPQRQRAQIHCNSGTSSLLKHEEVAGDFSEYTRSTNSSSSSFSNSLEPLDLLLLGDLTILLLKYKFNLYDQDKKGMSVWHYLCRDSYFELFERFIQNELKVNPKKIMELVDFSGNTLLHSCCTLGSLRHLKKILFNLKPASLDQKNIHGFTPIHLAIKNQQWDCANFLLENNANITKTTRSEAQRRSNYPKSNNILHLIFSHISPITSSTLEFVKKIIKSKPQLLEQPNEKNELVLELCVQSGHYQLIPLICSCMKDQNKLIQSLEKCHKIAYHAPRSSIIQSSDFYTVLKYGQLHELVGKSFKGIIKTINFESSIPTFEFLLQEAKLRTQSQKSVSI